MRQMLCFILALIFTSTIFSSNLKNKNGDVPQSNYSLYDKNDKSLDFYGSLRFKGGITYNQVSGIADQFSRIGLNGKSKISDGFFAIAKFEVGVNLITDGKDFVIDGDPGPGLKEINNIFYSRQGYVGFKSIKFGELTWGKRWGVYYDIGSWTDMFYIFGGTSIGVYAAGTEGNISGTGRAPNTIMYRYSIKKLNFAIQTQNRHLNDLNAKIFGTAGFSMRYEFIKNLTIGAAYNQVFDGIENPSPRDSKLNDKSSIIGFLYDDSKLYVSANFAYFEQHEMDDKGNWFDGIGSELYSHYYVTPEIQLVGGLNYQKPTGSYNGGFSIINYIIGGAYHFRKDVAVALELKFDFSKAYDFSKRRDHAIGFAMYYQL